MRTSLQPPPGIFGDDTSFSKAGRWWTCKNVRFWRDQPQIIGGWEQLCPTLLTGVCRATFAWTDINALMRIAFGTHSHLLVWSDEGGVIDITPTGLATGTIDSVAGSGWGIGTYGTGDYSEPQVDASKLRTWDLAAWGEHLLAHPRGGSMFQWTLNPAAPAAALANAPGQVASMLVASQDQVFALGCEEEVSGSFNPLCIRHSGLRGNTVWNTAPDTSAREYILPGGGRIVAGRVVGPNLLIWTTHALYLGTYVGSPSQVWRFDRVGEKCGLVAPNAAVVVGQSAYWLGPDLQFRQYNLGGAAEIIPCPIRDDLADNMVAAQVDKIVASSCSKFAEVRFDYPDARDGQENSRYVAVSLIDGAWYRGDIARTSMIDSGPQERPIGVTADGQTFWHESGQSADGAPIAWEIETADQYLSEDVTAMLLGIWPDLSDQLGPVNFTVTTRLRPQGDLRVHPTVAAAPGQGKVDIRARGRLFRLRLSGFSSPAAARIGRIVAQYEVAGGR